MCLSDSETKIFLAICFKGSIGPLFFSPDLDFFFPFTYILEFLESFLFLGSSGNYINQNFQVWKGHVGSWDTQRYCGIAKNWT